jgi:hypothetical protein
MDDIKYDMLSNVLTVNGEVLEGKKGFPVSSESSVAFQSKPHYVRLRGKPHPESLACVYHYTRETWMILGTSIQVANVEYWY